MFAKNNFIKNIIIELDIHGIDRTFLFKTTDAFKTYVDSIPEIERTDDMKKFLELYPKQHALDSQLVKQANNASIFVMTIFASMILGCLFVIAYHEYDKISNKLTELKDFLAEKTCNKFC